MWGASCLHRYAPTGKLLEQIPVPARQPTSVALTPDPPYRALVTTALHGLDKPCKDDGRLLMANVAVAGLSTSTFG